MTSKNFNMSFDPQVRQQFAEIVGDYGLTVPQAFKLLANQVIKTGVLPLTFDWNSKQPNLETQKAMLQALEERKTAEYYESPEALFKAVQEFSE